MTAVLDEVVMTIAVQLGGKRVYQYRVSVDRTNGEAFPDQFVPVMPDSGLEDEKPSRAEHDRVPILLVRRGDRLFAMAETWSHFGAPLSEGKLVGGSIVRPWHASRFGLEDGSVINGRMCIPGPAWKFAYAMDRLKCANIWTVLPSRHRSVCNRSSWDAAPMRDMT